MSDRGIYGAWVIGTVAIIGLLAGCAHDPCRAVEKDALNKALIDSAAVLTCAAGGTPLATCEQQQLSSQVAGLTPDVLMCGENAIAQAAQGTHAAAGAP